jgi:4-hydroxybenzoate polyprenyltransferase
VWWSSFEPLAFSSLWVALAAVALAGAASGAMGLPAARDVLALVGLGTWIVYTVDRVRDVARDRHTAPRRTAFVERHLRVLVGVTVVAAVAAAVLAPGVGPGAALVLAPAAVLGFFHRRVKHVAFAKSSYVTLAWVCVVVIFPAVALGEARHVAWTALVVGAALQANAIASNVRDLEAGVPRLGRDRALGLARGAAGLGVVIAALAPAPVRVLLWIPAVTGAALWRFRADEGYGLVVVDGALLLGGLVAWTHHTLAT